MSENKWAAWDDSLENEDDVRLLALNDMRNDLLFAAVEIGHVVNMEYWAVDGMVARVRNTGRKVNDITVGELIEMLKEQQRFHADIEEKFNTKIEAAK